MALVEQFSKLVGPLFKHTALCLVSKNWGSNSFVLKLWRLFVLEGGVAIQQKNGLLTLAVDKKKSFEQSRLI